MARQPVYLQTSVRKIELAGSAAQSDEGMMRDTREVVRRMPAYQESIFRFFVAGVPMGSPLFVSGKQCSS